MKSYALKRLVTSVFLFLALVFLVFLILELLPGDSVTVTLGAEAGVEDLERARADTENTTLISRYFSYLSSVLHGDFGKSAAGGESVAELIKSYAAPSIILSLLSLLLTAAISFGFTYLFVRRKGKISNFFYNLISLLSQAAPAFVIAFLLMLLFSVRIPIFPVAGYDPERPLYSLFLPSLSLSLMHSGFIIRNLKKGFEREESKSYVRAARARGESQSSVIIHEMAPALTGETVTLLSQSFITFITASAAIEYVFSIPGWGLLAIQSVSRRDVMTLAALTLLFCAISVLITLISDIVTMAINKRRSSGE